MRRYHHYHSHSSSSSTASSMDKLLLFSLGILALVFTTITVTTYSKVAHQYEQATTSSSLSSTSTQQAAAIRRNNQQPQRQPPLKNSVEELQSLFPIRAMDDTETIPHPGLGLIQNDKEREKAGLPKTMVVPQFFDTSHGHYYFNKIKGSNHTIRHYLGDGQQLMDYETALTVGSKIILDDDNRLHETIYCSIASYRDPECTGTVQDLYERAEFPQRIRVAILDQRVPGSDDPVCGRPVISCQDDPNQVLCKFASNIEYYEMNAQLAVGPVFARHLMHRFYRGEYFAMQIDSHVRFVEHWDTDIVGQWQSANNEMGVLSTYLSDIINSIDPVTHKGQHPGRPIMCASDYEGSNNYKHLRHGQQPEGTPGITGQPTLHPFWAAGFSFARAHFVIQVPYDQYLPMVFQGEEISIGLRGFTYGYDYYAPERSVCFHMYAINENKERRKKVPLFWENGNLYRGVGETAMMRLNSIIHMGTFPDDQWDHREMQKYGLGTIRNVDKFFKVFGIHVQEQKVENHLCRFVGKPMMKVFMPALRKNHMGLDYNQIQYEFKDPEPEVKEPIHTAQKKN